MPTRCCVPLCSNSSGGHKFPEDAKLKAKWLAAIKRDRFIPKTWSTVCYLHFQEDDYITETSYGSKPRKNCLKSNAVPSVFKWTKQVKSGDRKKRYENRCQKVESIIVKKSSAISVVPTYENCETMSSLDFECPHDIGCEIVVETSGNTAVHSDHEHSGKNNVQVIANCMDITSNTVKFSRCTQTVHHSFLSVQNFVNDCKSIHYYSGLESYEKFQFVLSTLCPKELDKKCTLLSVEDQFFLTLIRLRRHTPYFELARGFDIQSEKTVSVIIHSWFDFMYQQWSKIDLWPEREIIDYYMPRDFKSNFPSTRVTLDGLEIKVKSTRNPTSQQAIFSHYKNSPTVKSIVGITPGRLVSYVSPTYAGSTSDRQIVERSRLMQMCDPKDSIMADKGFNVQDLFAAYQVSVNIPTFLKGKNQFSPLEIQKDKKIASKRVHVERIIGLGRTYKILRDTLDTFETKMSNKIKFVCFMLCNFRSTIVGKNA